MNHRNFTSFEEQFCGSKQCFPACELARERIKNCNNRCRNDDCNSCGRDDCNSCGRDNCNSCGRDNCNCCDNCAKDNCSCDNNKNKGCDCNNNRDRDDKKCCNICDFTYIVGGGNCCNKSGENIPLCISMRGATDFAHIKGSCLVLCPGIYSICLTASDAYKCGGSIAFMHNECILKGGVVTWYPTERNICINIMLHFDDKCEIRLVNVSDHSIFIDCAKITILKLS